MDKMKKWKNLCKAKDIVEVLNKKHFKASYVETLEEARDKLLEMIEEGASVAIGGSTTLSEMGLVDILRNGKYKFFDRYQDLPFDPDIVEIHRKSLTADFLVTGTNAITKNGELVNTDCTGNRVAPMIFGPKNVIIVTGVNKIVGSLEDAFKRIREIAPMNAKRIKHETPCVETGTCVDCDCKKRICNFTTIIHNGIKFEGRIKIIIIADEIGY
ncbi:lactate utilization protein [Pelosinus sp. UFO1]|uniref:lactate utilization protein n=1 Tax=Pelosinus sp. UFO1 TaxID=484770 RepID=UPI0004D1967E|nr:lactate utilization protein [Pelosinus sp. UFO1]AIF50372.1 Lactate utilization protein B/C [Pelosinus sp. UFO1]